jgi:hypothetical protein
MAWSYLNTVNFGMIDHSGEKTRSTFYLEGFAAPGAADLPTELVAKHDAVKAGIAAVSLCNFTESKASVGGDTDVAVIPVSPYAQREIGLWVQWVDTVNGDYGSMTIPGPDLTLLAQANTDEVDIAANVTALAFIAILEANLVSRDANAIQVTRMRIVGRSN